MRTARSSWVLATAALSVIALAGRTDASGQAATPPTTSQQAGTMKIRIDVEGATMTGTLEDNATARDVASLLPLTVTLADYAETEKISDLPRRLSTEGAPAAPILRSGTSPTTLPGAIWPSSIETSVTRGAHQARCDRIRRGGAEPIGLPASDNRAGQGLGSIILRGSERGARSPAPHPWRGARREVGRNRPGFPEGARTARTAF